MNRKVEYVVDGENTYLKPVVEAYLLSALPDIKVSNNELVIDRITDLIVNTRQIRLAAKPRRELADSNPSHPGSRVQGHEEPAAHLGRGPEQWRAPHPSDAGDRSLHR